jgi:hypothetical protein
MSKEMPPLVTDELGEEIGSQVQPTPTRRGLKPADVMRVVPTLRPPLRPGIGKIGAVPPPAPKQKTIALAQPPPDAARINALGNVERRIPSEPHSEVRPSEKTQVHRPNLSDPKLRPSKAPAASQQERTESSVESVPKQPKLPSVVVADSVRSPNEQASHARSKTDEEERTRVCPAAIIENLLQSEDSETGAMSSAADVATRFGEIPIEELVMAKSGTSNANVGHEDVTRAYDIGLLDTPSQITAPRKRLDSAELETAPRFSIRAEPHKRRIGWLASLLLVVAVCASVFGWIYRQPLGRQAKRLQTSFLQGIDLVARVPAASQKRPPPVAQVIISISVSPEDAVLAIDGSRVSNPFSIRRNADRLLHEISAGAPGYAPLQRRVQFDRDLTVVMALAPVTPSTPVQPEVQEPTSVAADTPRVVAKRAPAKPRPTKSTGVNVNCSPPFVIDADGIRSYKPECL